MTSWARPIETGWVLADPHHGPRALPAARSALDRLLAKAYRPVRDVVVAYEVDGRDGTARGVLCLIDPTAVDSHVWHSEEVYPRIVAERAAALLGLGRATSAALLVPVAEGEALTAAVGESVGSREPQVRTTDAGGRTHRLWLLEDHADLLTAVQRRQLLVADGNHRVAAATSADLPLLALVTAGPDLRIGAIHRALTGTGLRVAELAAAWRRAGLTVREQADPSPPAEPGTVTVPGGLVVDLPASGEPLPRIDHGLVERVLIAGALGIDPEGPHVRAMPEGRVPGPDVDALLQLAPVPFADVLAMHEQGRRMPRKSTYFTPKPAAGLLIADLPA
ncbi:MAG TPA: DUF1015 family protein [Amycolatopsis sp.]|nr:DUF1015 family protein [Amycolatopsis sp.]